ncbi:MAG: RNA polymerase sigma factor [Phycisphaerae bacterium]
MDHDPRVRAAIDGDTAAMAELLREHAATLRGQLSIDAKWQSIIDVDDVLQVTYLEAFLRIGSFADTGPGSLLAWLRRIADNNLRDAIKGLQRLKRPPPMRQAARGSDESAVELLDLLGVTTTSPSRELATTEMKTALAGALAALPDDYARVIRLYDLEGRSIEETVASCGRSAGAVHMLRARAHARLRELLGENPFLSVGS